MNVSLAKGRCEQCGKEVERFVHTYPHRDSVIAAQYFFDPFFTSKPIVNFCGSVCATAYHTEKK